MTLVSRQKLTRPLLQRLTCPQGRDRQLYWDTAIPGFGVVVFPTGRRTFVVQYRTVDGRSRRDSIGDVRIISLEEARAKARTVLSQVRLGQDPQAAKRAARQGVRFRDLVEEYLEHAQTKLRHRTYLEVVRHLRKQAAQLHGLLVGNISRAEVSRLLEAVRDNSGPTASNRLRASLSALWSWGLRTGRIEGDNPVAYVPKLGKEVQRDRVLTDPELELIWRCTAGGTDHDRIVRLLMLTGARREEVGSMAWSEIEGNVWTLPRERTKNGLPHEVPLTELAKAQLPTPRPGRSLVFGSGAGGFSGWSKCKARLDERMRKALREDFVEKHGREPSDDEAVLVPWTLHDLRRTVSTWCNENGVEPHIVEALLNHVSGTAKRGVAGVYNKAAYRAQKAEALARWETHIQVLVRDSEGRHAQR